MKIMAEQGEKPSQATEDLEVEQSIQGEYPGTWQGAWRSNTFYEILTSRPWREYRSFISRHEVCNN